MGRVEPVTVLKGDKMKHTQGYLLKVTYYKLNNPMNVFSLEEYHFSKESAERAVKRLEFLGYTIENSDVSQQLKNYSRVS